VVPKLLDFLPSRRAARNGDKGCSSVGIGTRPKYVAQCRNPPLMDQHQGEFIAGKAEFSD